MRRVEMCLAALLIAPGTALAQHEHHSTAERPQHPESARQADAPPTSLPADPPLPEGMTLDEALDYAEHPPPEGFPHAIHDDPLRAFLLVEQLEYRLAAEGHDQVGWEAQAWTGFDFNRLWIKTEGEAVFDGVSEGESETDLLYGRLIAPFWTAQIGVQYANEWESGDYGDRWSGVVGVQGIAPGSWELDAALYVSERADFTAEFEAEYDQRITQRLVLQPRAELLVAFEDIPGRRLGAGLASADLDLRLRYEIHRKLAPYVGVRYHLLAGETRGLARAAGDDPEEFFFIAGLRIAF